MKSYNTLDEVIEAENDFRRKEAVSSILNVGIEGGNIWAELPLRFGPCDIIIGYKKRGKFFLFSDMD